MTTQLLGDITYPKSSCYCTECPVEPSPQQWPHDSFTDGLENNLGLLNCDQLDVIQNCNSVSSVGKVAKMPNPWLEKDNYRILNPNFGLGIAPGFYKNPNGNCDCPQTAGKDPGVTSFDPRLVYPIRGPIPLALDKPPYTGNVLLKDIYEDDLTNYGKNYTNYRDIRGGQLMYYQDLDLTPPYFMPVNTVRSSVRTEVLKTPMGGLWPQYPKTPLTKKSEYLSPQQFTRDTVTWREEISALQSSKMNRQNYPL